MNDVRKELLYHGKRMQSADVLGRSVKDIAFRLRAGLTTHVTLEPGDATRYDLTLVPVHAELGVYEMYIYVMRTIGGEHAGVITTHVREPEDLIASDLSDSAGWSKNEWSIKLLAWWLTLVLDELRAVMNEPVPKPTTLEEWRARAVQAEDLLYGLKHASIDETGVDFAMGGEAVKAFAVMAIEWFKQGGGKNYLEAKIIDPREPMKMYALIVQALGPDKKSPADFRKEAEDDLEDAVKMMRKAVRADSLEPVRVWLGVNRPEANDA